MCLRNCEYSLIPYRVRTRSLGIVVLFKGKQSFALLLSLMFLFFLVCQCDGFHLHRGIL